MLSTRLAARRGYPTRKLIKTSEEGSMMSDRDVEDVDLLVIAAARREITGDGWTVLRRAGRSPWSSGTRSVGLLVFLVGSRLRFS